MAIATIEPPATEPGSNAVAEPLVDLENGHTPAPPQSLMAAACPPISTVVLLDVGGVKQPVTVPLTPDQCTLAGLTLANQVDGQVEKPPAQAEPPAQLQAQASAVPPADPPADPKLDDHDDRSRQEVKNMKARFNRSEKRFLEASLHTLYTLSRLH